MRTQSAPRNWVGTAMAFDQILTVDAEIRRDILEQKSESNRQVWIPGEYFLKGKLRAVPLQLLQYVGHGRLLVDFGGCRGQCRKLRQGRKRHGC